MTCVDFRHLCLTRDVRDLWPAVRRASLTHFRSCLHCQEWFAADTSKMIVRAKVLVAALEKKP